MYLNAMTFLSHRLPPSLDFAREALLSGDMARFADQLSRAPSLAVERDESGYTLMHHACYFGHLAAIEVLWRLGASALCPDADGFSPVHTAALQGRHEALWLLRELGLRAPDGPPLQAKTLRGPLAEAIKGGHLESARAALAMGFVGTPVHGQTDCPWSELFRLSRRPAWGTGARLAPGQAGLRGASLFDAFGQAFIESGLPATLADAMGNGLVFFAAMYENCAAIEWLHAHGAHADKPNHSGIRPLWACCRDGKARAAQTLLDLGADPLALGPQGESCASVALRHERVALFAQFEALELSAIASSSSGSSSGSRSL